MVTNLRVQVQSVDRATLVGVLTAYGGDGVPVLPLEPPIMVANNECEFVSGADGV